MFTFRLMWLPRGEGRPSLEAPRTELRALQCLSISVLKEQSHSCGPRVLAKLKQLVPSKALAEAWPTSGCLIQGLCYDYQLKSWASS